MKNQFLLMSTKTVCMETEHAQIVKLSQWSHSAHTGGGGGGLGQNLTMLVRVDSHQEGSESYIL